MPRDGRGRVTRALLVLAAALVAAGIGLEVAGSGPDRVARGSTIGPAIDMWFTTYSPPTVQRVSVRDAYGKLSMGTPVVVAALPGADGLAFSPSGDLVVGGQATGQVFDVKPSGSYRAVAAGTKDAYLVDVDPSGRSLYSSGLPGTLVELPVNPLGPGHTVRLTGDDKVVTALAFGPNGQTLYTASSPGGIGSIGTLDLGTGRTHRLFSATPGAHGIAYDPYTGTYIVVGASTVLQLPASDPSKVVSQFSDPGMRFDQVAVTGNGQALVASNTGYLVMIDYSATKRVGDISNRVSTAYLAAHLDDVAPLIGAGAKPLATDAAVLRRDGLTGILAGASLFVVLGGLAVRKRIAAKPRASRTKKLPRWDRRRSGASGI